ncbi:MAG TPA: metallopeptidase TldD-related protein, partial [Acidimicrobiales bacterium]|nr:metallopeptidase TldD-related protein [Acidimicrobiales bacterium]
APVFNLLHRPTQLAAAPAFDSEGFPNRDLDLIRDGVLESFAIGWYGSHKLGRPMTSGLTNLVVAPGHTALADIIAATDRGILLGRFSGGEPNQNLDFSGVAKNSFYVEGGKVIGPITETMIAGNFQTAIQSIRAISSETVDTGYSCYPWLATTGITISTK